MSSPPATQSAFEPLRVLRYDPAQAPLDQVIAPPYDVIGPAERTLLMQRSPHSVVRLILPDSPNAAADLLHAWTQSGVLDRDMLPAVWWHDQRFTGPDGVEHTRSGFVAGVRLSPYSQGRIRPHEQTHSSVKADLLELVRSTRANFAPLFGLYDDPTGAAAALAPDEAQVPDMAATDGDGTEHRFWRVDDADAILATQLALAESEILIADGHHRYETALAYQAERRERDGDPADDQPYDFVMMHLVEMSDPGLVIYPTHRVVLGSREVTPDLLVAFDVRELTGTPTQVEAALNEVDPGQVAFAVWRRAGRPALLATLRDRSAAMMAMPGSVAALRAVDSAVLEAVVLAPMLGMLDREHFLHTDLIRYVRELGAATGAVDAGESAAAFILRAPTVAQVRAVAAAGKVMPQKSTYFFPKLYSGFLLQPLDVA
ncbi:MAG TPA: DUF1015 domain-containing protein [Thermoleophilia bacterium]|nr:DUF1015 domain-containing protein [Thermoleophilia bacterium]